MRATGRQRVDPNQSVIGFVTPAMSIPGWIVHKEHHPSHRKTFYQALQECLRFAVNPMEILHKEDQRLPYALTDQNSLECLQGGSSSLPWFQIVKFLNGSCNVLGFAPCRRKTCRFGFLVIRQGNPKDRD